MTVVPAAVAQGPEPSGSELREAYPLHEETPPEADSGARPTPAAAEDRPAPAATQPSGGDSTVPIVIAAGLALLAFAAGFGLPLARARSRPAASGPGDNGDAVAKPSQARRFEPSSRSGIAPSPRPPGRDGNPETRRGHGRTRTPR
jgi:hypothetical protein